MKIQTKLKKLLGNDKLKDYVLNDILDDEDPENYIKDILMGGCVSGVVSSLIFYDDTAIFFDKFYNEIEELRQNYEEETGESLKIEGFLKNFLAWFAFEETAREIADQIGIEY